MLVFRTWSYTTGASSSCSPAVDGNGVVYIGNDGGKVAALDGGSGSLLWSFTVGGGVRSIPVIGDDGAVYFGRYALWQSHVRCCPGEITTADDGLVVDVLRSCSYDTNVYRYA